MLHLLHFGELAAINMEGKAHDKAGKRRTHCAVKGGRQATTLVLWAGVEHTSGICHSGHVGIKGNIYTHILFIGITNCRITNTELRTVCCKKALEGWGYGIVSAAEWGVHPASDLQDNG